MPYDEELAARLEGLVGFLPGIEQKRMFGGLAFLLHGRLLIAAGSKGWMMVRVDPAEHDRWLEEPGAEAMVMNGRETRGWLRVDAAEVVEDEVLQAWVGRALAFVRTLPPKD